MGSLSVHLAQLGAFLPGRLCSTLHHDESESTQDVDRKSAEDDFKINIKAELEIELLHQKIDQLRETEVLHLTEAVNGLTAHLRKDESRPSTTAST
jgi:hypothetical protein